MIFRIIIFIVLALGMSAGAYTNHPAVFDSAGLWSTNGSLRNVSVVGQGTPPGFTSSATHQSHNGFLKAFVYNTVLDSDNDGILDENDHDDDNDGMADSVELSGLSFDPFTSTDITKHDSDGDGMSDQEESIAGTNPLDTNSLLQITSVGMETEETRVIWNSRSSRQYQVLSGATPEELRNNPTVLGTISVVGGSGQWQENTSGATNLGNGESGFIGIRVIR